MGTIMMTATPNATPMHQEHEQDNHTNEDDLAEVHGVSRAWVIFRYTPWG